MGATHKDDGRGRKSPVETLMTCCSSQSPRDANPGGQALRPDHVWRPFELQAMVLGFMFFWPIGLAVIGFKIWQRRSAYPGDLHSFLQERVESLRNACGDWRNSTWNSAAWHSAWEAPDAPATIIRSLRTLLFLWITRPSPNFSANGGRRTITANATPRRF